MLHLNVRLSVLLDELERPVLLVALDLGVVDLAADQTLGVEDRVFGVRVVRVFRGVADTVFFISGSGRWSREGAYSRSSSEKATHEGVIR